MIAVPIKLDRALVLSEKGVVVQKLENARYLEKPISAAARVSGGKGKQSELKRRAATRPDGVQGRVEGVQILALVNVNCVGVDRVSVAGVGGSRVPWTAYGGRHMVVASVDRSQRGCRRQRAQRVW